MNDRVVMIAGNASETCSSVCQTSDRPTTVTIVPASSGATGSSLNGDLCQNLLLLLIYVVMYLFAGREGHLCTLDARGTNCNNIRYFIFWFNTSIVIQAQQDPESK